MTDAGPSPSQRVVELCLRRGFAAAGVCDLAASAYADELRDWLGRGCHGSMAYLEKSFDVRTDPSLLLEDARSAVMVADLYAVRSDNVDPPLPEGHGRIARYGRGRDYHDVIKKRLHAVCDELRSAYLGEQFRAFVDTAPVLERELAARAGIGWTGKHTLAIHPELGSYLLLGGFVTTMALEPPASQAVITDHCGSCTRCIDACPTDAITPYSVDATRCISYLTIERRGPIDAGLFEGVGDWLYGCDVCQEVCPHNSAEGFGRTGDAAVIPAYASERSSFDLLGVLGWDEDERREALRGSAMKRAKLSQWRRNAVVCLSSLARAGDARARAAVEAATRDGDPLVAETAKAAVRGLAQSDGAT
ncbi:MAG: tRNA epoxyqueuosine(34) reductase QueG, partial [Planctomycetota bacterium]